MSEEKMRELGFTDHREGWWYNCYRIDEDVTLNLSMNKDTGEWEEYVLNEMFGQPEYYGRMQPKYRKPIIERIDAIIAELKEAGLPFEVDHSLYGVTKGEN